MTAARPGRVLPVDAALALGVGAASLVSAAIVVEEPDHGPGSWRHGPPPYGRGGGPAVEPAAISGWELGAVLGLVAGLGVRRLYPRLGFAVVVVAVATFLAAGGPYGPVLIGPVLAVHALSVSVPPRHWVPLLPALLPMLWAGFWRQPYAGLLDSGLYAALIFGSALIVLPGLIGLLARARREADIRDREAERERYLYEERLRIAREVHDVVGHSLSVISLQAGVALHVLDKKPEEVGAALEAIRTSSRDALAELRSTLGTFRDPATLDPTGPQPGLDRLPDLVEAVRAAGRSVDVVAPAGLPNGLPAAVDHAAYRIVQEALTNVVRHAPGATARVTIERLDGHLEVRVADDGRPMDSHLVAGNGIAGMRERALAVGGRLEVRPNQGRGIVVQAVLPVGSGVE
jgi:signal transduction histidine kinase